MILHRWAKRSLVVGLAMLVNLLFTIALIGTSRGSVRPSSEDADTIEAYFVLELGYPERSTLRERPLPRLRTSLHRSLLALAPRQEFLRTAAHTVTPSVTTATLGPPTETPASIAAAVVPDRPARLADPYGLTEMCQRLQGGEVIRRGLQVELRLFVLPDGKISQGKVVTSSGDPHADEMTLRCLQMYANLEPVVDEDDSPVGSWQRLTWLWR